jgi:hypothetical protein
VVSRKIKQVVAMAAVLAGASVPAHAAFTLDLTLPGNAKSATVTPGSDVNLQIWLRNMPASSNGLSVFTVSVISRQENANGSAWGTPTSSETVVDATDSALATLAAFNTGRTEGSSTVKDVAKTFVFQTDPDPSDTDIDIMALGAAQNHAGTLADPWAVNVGVGTDLLLGTATFHVLVGPTLLHDLPWSVHLNSYLTATDNLGGLVLRGLNTSNTTGSNGVDATNWAKDASFVLGSDIVLTVIPEPSTLAVLSLAGLSLLRGRRKDS